MLDGANKVSDLKNKVKDNLTNKDAGGSKNAKQTANAIDEEKTIDDKNMLSFLEGKMKEMETEYDIIETLVIDMGNAYTKIGFSGEDLPRLIVPSIYGSLKEDINDKKSEILSFEIK